MKKKKGEPKALSKQNHPAAAGFIACLNRTRHQGAPNWAFITSSVSSCSSYVSKQLDISECVTHLRLPCSVCRPHLVRDRGNAVLSRRWFT